MLAAEGERALMESAAQVTRDTYVLLGLGIVVLLFIAYEIAGLTLPGWHTISFIAKHHPWLYTLILTAFAVGGPVGVWWWAWHINFGTISR